MAEQLIPVAAQTATSMISKIWQHFKCLWDYNKNINKLKEKVNDLECEQSTIKVKVDVAERDGQFIMDNVSNWMVNVDDMKKQVDEVVTRTSNTQWGCLSCKCPKLHSRYKLSKQALELTTEVNGLKIDASNLNTIGYHAPPGQMPFTSVQVFENESQTKIGNDVMEALGDDSITTIGICGMAGVGKTTLVNEIADKVKAAKSYGFNEVVMAVVSKDFSIRNIQDQLAENIGLTIQGTTDHRRAEELYLRLKQNDKKILVILDDLWEKLDFHKIGIPKEGERGGLKVLLTSRYIGVCKDMNAKPFEVNVLSKEESWNLFKEIAEISEEMDGIRDIAQEVVNECGGLPLAIVIVGGVLKGKKDYFWREVLRQLKDSCVTSFPDVPDKVYSVIKLSYDHLEKESQTLLLLCSLFPEDYNIPLEDLVRYANGFINVRTIEIVRDKVDMIVDVLRGCYLLLKGYNEKYVKLHDVVRDVCLSIATSGEHIHTVRHNALMEWPQDDRCLSSTAISLSFHKINQLSCGLDYYGELKLLRLSFTRDELHIHADFFERMKEIKVLELRNFKGELPSSLESLMNLRTLFLHNCRLYGEMSVIGSQTKLEILSFYNSILENFPDKISELSNLKCLDIRFVKGPSLPSGILSRFQNLEELYLGSRKEEEDYSVIIKEISSLLNLQTFQFYANTSQCLEQVLSLHHEKLKRFEFFSKLIGKKKVGKYQLGNVLYFENVNVDLLQKHRTRYLFSNTKALSLLRTKRLTNLIQDLDPKGFMNLQELQLQYCDFKCLIDATSFSTRGGGGGVFINLEKLIIENAEKCEELCHGDLPNGSFGRLREVELSKLPALRHLWSDVQQPFLVNLRRLKISKCYSIRKCLFPKSVVKYLLQLEEMNIEDCAQLETIVLNGEEDDIGYIEFPMLKHLKLVYLKGFRSFETSSTELICGGLLKNVMLPNLKKLSIIDVPNIKWIVNGQMSTSDLSRMLHSIHILAVGYCSTVEGVFDFTGLNVNVEESCDNLFAQLESMWFLDLPKMKHLWRMLPEGIYAFRNLRNLNVIKCDSLRYLLSPSMAKMLAGLEQLEIYDCKKMKAIIAVDETEISQTAIVEDSVKKEKKNFGEENTNIIVFPKLTKLIIRKNNDLRMLCSVNADLELPSLTELEITECPKMNKFCAGQLSATSLHNVVVAVTYTEGTRTSHKKSVNEFSLWLKDCESGIRCVNCSYEVIESCAHLD